MPVPRTAWARSDRQCFLAKGWLPPLVLPKVHEGGQGLDHIRRLVDIRAMYAMDSCPASDRRSGRQATVVAVRNWGTSQKKHPMKLLGEKSVDVTGRASGPLWA